MISFSYELVVGTCRRGDSSEGTTTPVGVTVSRVMKVPIRVYNWVSGESLLENPDLSILINR